MKPTSRNNGHLRSDDGQTHTHTDRQTPNPLIDSSEKYSAPRIPISAVEHLRGCPDVNSLGLPTP